MSAAAAVAEIDRAFRLAHGGGLEEVRPGVVRFTRMCSACPSRAFCFEHSVRPHLGDVEVEGLRLSRQAQERVSGH